MDPYIVWGLAGGVTAVLSLWATRREALRSVSKYPHYERQAWAIFLFVAALIYVGFALFNGAEPKWMGIELIGLAAYSALAFAGATRWPILVGIGWLAHAGWDHMVHPGGHPGFVPAWYVPLCLGFDLVVGAYLVGPLNLRRERLSEASA